MRLSEVLERASEEANARDQRPKETEAAVSPYLYFPPVGAAVAVDDRHREAVSEAQSSWSPEKCRGRPTRCPRHTYPTLLEQMKQRAAMRRSGTSRASLPRRKGRIAAKKPLLLGIPRVAWTCGPTVRYGDSVARRRAATISGRGRKGGLSTHLGLPTIHRRHPRDSCHRPGRPGSRGSL